MSGSSSSAPADLPPKVDEVTFLTVIWVLVGIASTFVALRAFLRIRYNGRFQLDDLFTFIAYLLLIALASLYTVGHSDLFYLIRLSAGLVPPPTTAEGLESLVTKAEFTLKQSFACMICFWSCLWMVKASFLTFFYPLSEGLIWDRRLWYAVVTFVSLSYIAIIIDFPLTCGTDARNNFRLNACTSTEDIHRQQLSLRMSTALDILTDVSIIVIPWKILFIVQKSRKEKLAIGSIVGLGVFIIVFAIIRVIVTNTTNTSPEPVWLEMWSAIETSVAVTVISMTALKVYVARAVASKGYDSRVFSGRAARTTTGPSHTSRSGRGAHRGREGAIPLDDVSQTGSDRIFRSNYHAEVKTGGASHDSDEVLV